MEIDDIKKWLSDNNFEDKKLIDNEYQINEYERSREVYYLSDILELFQYSGAWNKLRRDRNTPVPTDFFREIGYYWVKLEGIWTVAMYTHETNRGMKIGVWEWYAEQRLRDEDFDEIDERMIVQQEQKQ